MNKDIAHLLRDWEYDPDNTVRFIDSENGRQMLQVRLPLGIEQYELDGRPDGLEPFGRESVLDEMEFRLQKFIEEHGEDSGFCLEHKDFEEVHAEGLLYYYRYLLLFQIGDYKRTCRDTDHNLRICRLVEKYCTNKDDRESLLQYKPYIIRVNALSRSMLYLGNNDKRRALATIRTAIDEIESGETLSSMVYRFERDRSLEQLRGTIEQLSKFETGEVESLEEQLEEAVENEDYEKAARLRDKILSLKRGRE
jgi:hypothetical protein